MTRGAIIAAPKRAHLAHSHDSSHLIALCSLPTDLLELILTALPSFSILALLSAARDAVSPTALRALSKCAEEAVWSSLKRHPLGRLCERTSLTRHGENQPASSSYGESNNSLKEFEDIACLNHLAFVERLDLAKGRPSLCQNDIETSFKNASIWSSGRNDAGQGVRRGVADVNGLVRTIPHSYCSGDFIVSVAAGGRHSAALLASGTLLMSGANENGQLGVGDLVNRSGWVPVNEGCSYRVAMIACGARHSIVLTGDGKVLACGANESGQLGLDSDCAYEILPNTCVTSLGSQTTCKCCNPSRTHSFVEVGGIELKDAVWLGAVVQVAAGFSHSMVLLGDGRVYAAGDNRQGQLGLSSDTSSSSHFSSVDTYGHRVVRVACGADTSMLLTRDNMILVSGKRSTGLSVIGGLGSSRITHLSVGEGFAVARTDENVVVLSRFRKRFEMTRELAKVSSTDVSSGVGHCSLVTEDGGIMAWGCNSFGQVATGEMGLTIQGGQDARIIRAHQVPLSHVHVPPGYRAMQLSAGSFHTLYLLVRR